MNHDQIMSSTRSRIDDQRREQAWEGDVPLVQCLN